jgi:hypothetical protein
MPQCQPFPVVSQSLVHRVSHPAVHPLDDVAVHVEGDAYVKVPEKLPDVLGMLACYEQYCSASVPEVV